MRIAGRSRLVGWVLVHVGDDDSLRVLRFDVFTRASFTVTACADFEVTDRFGTAKEIRGRQDSSVAWTGQCVKLALQLEDDLAHSQTAIDFVLF